MSTTQANGLSDEQKDKLERHQSVCAYCFAEYKGINVNEILFSPMEQWRAWNLHEQVMTELGLMKVQA